MGEVKKAIGYHEQNLDISREIGDRQGEANALGNLGVAHARLGNAEKATALIREARQIGQEINDPQIVQTSMDALASLEKGRVP